MPAHQKRTAHRDSSLSGNLPWDKSLHGPGGRSRDTEVLRHCSSDEKERPDEVTPIQAAQQREGGRGREGEKERERGRDFLSICTHNQFGLCLPRTDASKSVHTSVQRVNSKHISEEQ